MRKFRLSDLWWDDQSPGGRIALAWSRRKNSSLVGRRSFVRRQSFADAYALVLFHVLKTLAKIAVGVAFVFVVAALCLFVWAMLSQ
jgi:hypothetical protein